MSIEGFRGAVFPFVKGRQAENRTEGIKKKQNKEFSPAPVITSKERAIERLDYDR